MSKNLHFYEQVLVLHPDSFEEDHKEICQMISGIIEKDKGEFFSVDTWGSRPIANPKAKKVTRGIYFHLLFSAAPYAISELRRQLSINRRVLYFHEEKLPPKESLEERRKKFFECLEQSQQKEKDRQALFQKRQAYKT